MGDSGAARKRFSWLAWAGGAILWSLIVAGVGLAASDGLKSALGGTGSHLASFLVQLALTISFGYWLSRRVSLPRALWVWLGAYSILSVLASLWVIAFVLTLQWLIPEVSSGASGVFGEPVTAARLLSGALANDGSFMTAAIVAFFFWRKGQRSTSTSRRSSPLITVVSVAAVVLLAIGSCWLGAKVAIDFAGPGGSSRDVSGGNRVALAGGLGQISIPVGWTGHVRTYGESLPQWTALASYPPGRQLIQITSGSSETTSHEVHVMLLIDRSPSWQKRLSAWTRDRSLTKVSLSTSVLPGYDRFAYQRLDPPDRNGKGTFTLYIFISDASAPAILTLWMDYEGAPPSTGVLEKELEALQLRRQGG